MAIYTFGGYQLNANAPSGGTLAGLFFESKSFDMPVVKPISFPVARAGINKKSGEMLDARQIDIEIEVVGTSRTDLIARLDSLQQALALRGQQLMIHEDASARYYNNVDCLSALAPLGKGAIIATLVKIKFIAYDPISYNGTSSSYDTGTVALTSANSLWNFPAINITGGGTYYGYPLLHIINKTSTGSTTLSAGLTSGNNYTSISVAATPFSASTGDQVTITHSGTTQTLTLSSPVALNATSISVNSFTAGANYVNGDACAKVTQWNSIQISQTQDSQTLSFNSTPSVPLPNVNGDYVDVQCNPLVGMSIITNNSGKLSDPVGLFPVVEPGTTTFNIGISSSSAVSAECILSWVPRYLS